MLNKADSDICFLTENSIEPEIDSESTVSSSKNTLINSIDTNHVRNDADLSFDFVDGLSTSNILVNKDDWTNLETADSEMKDASFRENCQASFDIESLASELIQPPIPENDFVGSLYCICRQPDDHRLMVECNHCGEWFHAACVRLSKIDVQKLSEYMCPCCDQKPILHDIDNFNAAIDYQDLEIFDTQLPRNRPNHHLFQQTMEQKWPNTARDIVQMNQILPKDISAASYERNEEDSPSVICSPHLKKTCQLVDPSPNKKKRAVEEILTGDKKTLSEEEVQKHRKKLTESKISAAEQVLQTSRKLLKKPTHGLSLNKSVKEDHSGSDEELIRKSAQDGLFNAFLKYPNEVASIWNEMAEPTSMEDYLKTLSEDIERELFEAFKEVTEKMSKIFYNHAINPSNKDIIHADDIIDSTTEIKNFHVIDAHVGPKYKSKYRSLLFNIRDDRNGSLRKSLIMRTIQPVDLVQLSSEDLAPERVRDQIKERRKQALEESIMKEDSKNVNSDSSFVHALLSTNNSSERADFSSSQKLVRKTHKGDEIINPNDQSDTVNETLLIAMESSAPKSIPHLITSEEPQFEESLSSCENLPTSDAVEKTRSSESLEGSRDSDIQAYASLFASNSYNSMKEGYLSSKRASIGRTRPTEESSLPTILPHLDGYLVLLPTMPKLSICALYHSIIEGKMPLSPKGSPTKERIKMEELNLPSTLTIQGRIEPSKALEYLRQVIKSPSRTVLTLQIIGQSNESIIQKDSVVQSSPSQEDIDSGVASNSLSALHEHFININRFGVIYSNNNKPFMSLKKTISPWIVKDMYLIPVENSKPLPFPLSQIDYDLIDLRRLSHYDNISQALLEKENYLFLVLVLSKSTPNSTNASNTNSELGKRESFVYRSIDARSQQPGSQSTVSCHTKHSKNPPNDTDKDLLRDILDQPLPLDLSSTLDSLTASLAAGDSPLLSP